MNKKDLNILLPAITIIVIIGTYLVCSNLLVPKISDNLSRISAYNEDIAAANNKLDSILAADKSMTELSEVVNNLLIAVPDNVNSPDLITEVEAIAKQNQVTLPSLSPPVALSTNASSGYNTNLSVAGSFLNICGFINSLETSLRFSKINNISLSSTEVGLSATINFSVYSRPVVVNQLGVAE